MVQWNTRPDDRVFIETQYAARSPSSKRPDPFDLPLQKPGDCCGVVEVLPDDT